MTIISRNDGYSAQQGDGTVREAIPVFDAGLSSVGTGATHLAKAEDAAHTSSDVGIAIWGVRNDTNAASTSTDGDYSQQSVDSSGRSVNKPYSPAASDWSYAAAGSGISNTTTAVTIKTAAGAGIKNYITGIDFDTTGALGAATELAIRDGAGGTVLWRTQIGTGGLAGGRSIQFTSPLKGTANTLLEVVTLTASITGAVYFNAQGYVSP